MKKILSVIMVVAMLFTGIVPSVIGTAAIDVAEFALETAGIVENEETGVGTAELTLSLTNGAGVSGYTVYVYYQNADVTIVDAVYDEDELPVGTTPEFTYVTPGLKSTGRNYKANFTAAGIEPSSAIDFAMVECGYEYELLEEGPVCTLVLETVEMYEDLPEGFSFEVGVIIVEAYDVDDNDVAVCDNFTIAVESAAGDPWAPVYDVESFPEDQFTINVTGTNVYEGTVNDEGTLIAPVNIEFYGNNESNNVKGVWATRVFVYYPQEISLLGFENGRIYEDNNMNVGVLDDNILNPKLTNSAGVPQANAAAIKAFDVCGVDYETLDPNFTGLFFMPDDYRAQVFGDGVLATATLALPDDAQVGDEWYVGIVNDIADVSDTDNNDVAFVLDNGYIKIIPKLPAYEEETFPADQFTINMQGVTVAEGTEEITLDIEFYGNNADNNVKGVWATRVFVYYPQEIELLGFENGKIYADNNMNVGVLNDNIFDPKLTNSAGVPQANNAAIKAFDVCGVDYTTLDPNFTGLFFMPDDYRAQVFGDGTLATVTFKLPADAKAGTEWYVGIANDIADVSDTDNNDVAFVLDNGYIKIYGADVCDHAETIIEGAIDADCVNPGYTGDKVCAACGELVEAGSEIEALGHTAGGKEIVVEPTYTTEGSYVIKCSVCGEPLEEGIIPVLVQPVVTVGTVDGTIGKEVKVPVTIENNGGLFIASFTVNYDAVLTYTGFEIGDVFAADNVYVTETADGELVLYFEALDVADVTANGTLVNLVFAIDADASEGDAAVSIVANDDDCINVEGENVAIGTADGAVSMIYPQAIVVESVDVEYEKDAIVPVVITVNPGVWAIRAEINVGGLTVKGFNDGLFALVEGENYSIADGVITVFLEGAALENITDNAALFEIIVGLNDAQVGETADIGIELVEVIDVDGNDLDFLAKGGTITVIPCAHDEVTATETKAPSVYEEGVISYICNNCGETVATEAIPCLAGIIVSEFISAKAGEQAEVEVNLMNNPGLWSLSATFAFDANVFELAGIKSGSFTADEFSYSVADGVVTVYVESDDLSDVTMEGLAFTLVFNAISCGYSDIDVELVAENTINAAGENVDLVAVDGSVIIGCALTHSPFVAPSDVNGWLEYWYCEYCGACYSDAQGRYITNRKNCYIPANSISLSDETAEASADGKIAVNLDSNYGIWALGLEVAFDAEALTLKGIESGIFSADEISYSVNDGVITIFAENAELVDVTETGVAFYLVFEGNAAGTYDIDAELIAENTINAASENVGFAVDGGSIAFGHVCDYEYFEAVEATCHQNGMAAYYYCAECDVVYDEDYRVTNRKNLTIPATAEIIHMDAVEPACHYNGNIEYWYCSECNAVFADAALTQLTNRKNVMIPATAEIIYVEAVEAGCHQYGMAAYYYCSECDSVFDEDFRLTNRKNLVILPENELVYVPYLAPTATENGHYEYWYCPVCDAVFADAAGTQLTNRKNLTIEKSGFIIKASGNDYVASATLNGTTINVTPRVNAPYVKVSVKYAAGVKIACDAIVSRGPDWAILNIATGESATIVATDAYGNSMEYTVVVDWNNNFYTSVVNGYSTKNTEYVLNGDVINVYAKSGFNNASFGLVLTNGTTYTVSEGLKAVKSGAAIFFKALESAANDTYTITLTTSTGLELVITVNYVFDYQGIDGVLGGYMVDAIEVEDGNVINITTDAANKYASFRFILKNTTSDIEAAEDVEIVMQAGTNIHWMKIFNDGSNYVTTEVYVINANGVRETYTVNVTFGVN